MKMKNNRVVFETFEGRIEDLVGYQEISGHLVYNVKLGENFQQNTRFVSDMHLVDSPSFITYSMVTAS